MLIEELQRIKMLQLFPVVGLDDNPALHSKVFSKLAQKNINVDVILQSVGRDGTKDLTFSVSKDNGPVAA